MTTLYEISDQYNSALEEMTGQEIDQQTIDDTMEGLEGELNVKAKNVGAYYLNLVSDGDQIKQSIKNMQARLKQIESKADYFKEYLRSNMERTGIKKIECPQFKISLRKPSLVCNIINDELVPKQFKEKIVTTKIDKAGLKKWMFDNGFTSTSAAEIVCGKSGLTIK